MALAAPQFAALTLAAALAAPAAAATTAPATATATATATVTVTVTVTGWQACAAETRPEARLACYDGWAGQQAQPAAPAPSLPAPSAAPTAAPAAPALPALEPTTAGKRQDGCGTARSELARFWDLERATGCGVFGIRIYRPLQLGLVTADSVNRAPTSENPLNDVPFQPYRNTETRIQLSVRTKLAEGLLTEDGPLRDSLWFAYTQQSYWQVFTPAISRPFRSTDHEPELIYIHPLALPQLGGWSLRYGGVGVVHQSNGQSLPRSRSWNRVYLMAGADHPAGMSLLGRVWQRIPEQAADDDNPGISDYIGRAELTAGWRAASGSSLSLTVRNTLRDWNRGSTKLEWMVPLDSAEQPGEYGRLRVHASLFSGYGDSLLDYNRRRTVFSVGVSLVDW